MTKENEWLTAEKAAEIMGVSPSTLKNLARDNKITYSRPSHKIIFKKSDIEKYIEDNTHRANRG